mmetsp:Transcript_123533/g.193860  ORF Transcript_123533/g.193860 Transcript_123533/m.193860 type:complete len:206 (+) Transcript_123533:39-656(+)
MSAFSQYSSAVSRRLCASGRIFTLAALESCTSSQCRRFTRMKDSFPKFKPPPDPAKPSIARIVRQMDRSKTQKDRDESVPTRSSNVLSKHAPDTYLPSAAGTPAAAPEQIPGMGGGGPGSLANAFPPGWETFSGGAPRAPRRRTTKEPKEAEPHKLEVWGMRITAVLLAAIAYLELQNFSWGPTGLTRKQNKTVREGQIGSTRYS